jgi:hypothetical protein
MARRPRVPRGVSGIPAAKIILDGAKIGALVCKREPAGMAQHVRMNSAQACTLTERCNHVGHGSTHHLTIALGHEQPRQLVLSCGEITLEGSQFIAVQRMLS